MRCCFLGSPSIEGARSACKETLYEGVTDQLVGQSPPVLLDAIPTIGKTSAAALFASELCEGERDTQLTYLTHRTANREQFEEMVREFVSDGTSVDVTHLPVLDEDCPTAMGDHGDAWQSRLRSLRDQGLSPASLHRNQEVGLPCGGLDCPYMEWWTADDPSPLLVGHLSHAYVPEVVDDRVVIVDEDPGDAYQTRFTASELHELTREFLDAQEDLPASDLDEVKLLRKSGEAFADGREAVYEYAVGTDRFDIGQQILESGQGHVDAGHIVQALLAPEGEEGGDAAAYRVVLANDVEHVRLDGSTVAAYDPESGELALRQTPDFERAAALVGLDGTPVPALWRGRLGVDEISHRQVLCDECRQTYLTEILGYRIVQTTPYIKPYSGASGKRLSIEKDRGLLHEVERRTEGDIALITTKRVKGKLLTHDDGNSVEIPERRVNHYRNIKGSNEFAGDEVRVGVIIGSPHPGPNELRLLAGLSGDAFATERVEETRDGHHYSRREPTPEAEPYLRHAREHSVAQAVLRFGRHEGATVFVHTAALPAWMQSLCLEGRVTRRSDGERSVIEALRKLDKGTTAEIADLADVSGDTARIHLNALENAALVRREGTDHRIIWTAENDLHSVSTTVSVDLPEEFS